MAYEIDYSDERFTKVENQKDAALSDLEKTYSGIIDKSDQYYDAQIQNSKDWAEKQSQMQQEQTDFAIEQIEQQKDQAKKDYTKEQSGAYVDWQKQSNQYGVNAEQMAAGGMTNTGFSESSQVSMYNTYQNRVATAREAFSRAVLNYDNSVKEARLQNNSVLAEIAYKALQEQLELSLQGFQYKNQLILEQANKKTELENIYYNRYQDVLEQINHENALAEEIRQYNESLALQRQQLAEQKRQFDAQLAEEQRQFNAAQAAKGSSIIKSSGSGSVSSYYTSDNPISRGSSNTATVKSSSSSSKNIDMNSVIGLGYGPISASKLNQLVATGEVIEYKSGGVYKYKKNPNYRGSLYLPSTQKKTTSTKTTNSGKKTVSSIGSNLFLFGK